MTEEGIPIESPFIKGYLDRCWAKNLFGGTIKAKRNILARYEKFLEEPVEKAKARDVNRLLNELSEDCLALSTISRYISNIKLLYEYIDLNYPKIDVPNLENISSTNFEEQEWEKIRRETLSMGEIAKLIDGAESSHDKLLIASMVFSGLRLKEVADLRLDQLDMNKCAYRNIHGMSRTRSVPFPKALSGLMEEYLRAREDSVSPEENPSLFVSRRGNNLSPSGIRRIVHGTAQRAGIQEVVYERPDGVKIWKVTPHVLRYTFAQQAYRLGVPLECIKEILGHVRPLTTEVLVGRPQKGAFESYREVFDDLCERCLQKDFQREEDGSRENGGGRNGG